MREANTKRNREVGDGFRVGKVPGKASGQGRQGTQRSPNRAILL